MKKFDLIIIGSGPAGIEVESMLNDPNMKICIVEKEAASYGGVCVNQGCMPTKHLEKCANIIETTKKAKEFNIDISEVQIDISKITEGQKQLTSMLSSMHLGHSNAEVIFGHGRFIENKIVEITKENGEKEQITADKIVIATGSRPRIIPNLQTDGQYICDSTHMLNNTTIPKSLLIVGGGVIGLEFASIYNTYGSNVTVVEAAPMILPNEDIDTGMITKEQFEKRGIQVYPSVSINSAKVSNNKVECTFNGTTPPSNTYDKVLLAIGRTPNTDNIGLDNTDIKTTKGFIAVNEFLETSVSGVYAAGDIIPTMMLAHTAVYESMVITSNIKEPGSMKNTNTSVPRVIFSDPEIAGVGLTERQAKEKYGDIKVINFPMEANGKNVIEHQTDGRVKMIFEGKGLILVGASIIGKLATELIHELTLAVTHKLTYHDLKNTIHAHPTTSEIIWYTVFKGMLMDSTESFMKMMKDKI